MSWTIFGEVFFPPEHPFDTIQLVRTEEDGESPQKYNWNNLRKDSDTVVNSVQYTQCIAHVVGVP